MEDYPVTSPLPHLSRSFFPPDDISETLSFRPVLKTHHKVSRLGELHPEALAELYVSLSTHTAPIMEPRRTPICQ